MMYIARFGVGEDDYDLWDDVAENHKDLSTTGVHILYMTRRQDRGDTSLVLNVKDCDSIAEFIFKLTRDHPEITSVTTLSMMKPMFFPVPKDSVRNERFTVTVRCGTHNCEDVYQRILRTRPTEKVVITYVACIFMGGGRSLLISILSESKEALTSFLSENIESIEHVEGTEVTRMVRTIKLATSEEWKRTIRHNTMFEFLNSEEYDRCYLKDIIPGV